MGKATHAERKRTKTQETAGEEKKRQGGKERHRERKKEGVLSARVCGRGRRGLGLGLACDQHVDLVLGHVEVSISDHQMFFL